MAKTSWWCTRCGRILLHDQAAKGMRDTISAPVGQSPCKPTHDKCGGPVALSQRIGLKGAE